MIRNKLFLMLLFLGDMNTDSITELLAMLPGYNCGGCGYPGCSGMAAALADGSGSIDKCKPSKADVKAAIKQYLADHPKEA